MWHDDHPPSHFHAEYQGFEALVEIEAGEVVKGELPRKVASILREWSATHREELRHNWTLAQQFAPLDKIQGADRD